MAEEITLEVVTPEKMVFSGKVDEVTLPGTEGEFGVLRGHEPFLTSVDIGELYFLTGGKKYYYAVNTGYAEVTGSKVTVLIETAERADAIDKDRAIKAKETATASLAQLNKEHEDYEKMRLALVRAINRISVADKLTQG
ncbi:MAG: ATP synthase epsilon chain [Deltaproteobacteria bacterium ADurb.Bin151]|jgi:F-type H+-transporting ATPase subunit epsilon|nr:F0F1 ATP synthase subunit epsilon [Smithella sp.]OQB55054.1 MAG: ATP synthase epsilon chain [Deltaproteobacteria bacterium ADurb.Bin151]HNZ10601.1 F0F1 ATP synthase subunit epsilon [Smithellaceae bacterium]HOG81488.1 F0F1 ATP synthase subunit epsilon [Smithellaceae bacterium]HOQ41797.1 F0F1 ATP synthase subunit epsilon [Smithellaceae bacterium]